MKTVKRNLFYFALSVLAYGTWAQSPGYYLMNQGTVTYYGTTDTTDYMPIQVNTTGQIVISGNQKISATQYDATTAAQLNNASLAWVSTFNTSTDKCFVVASTHDASGNIYNVGAIRVTTSTSGLDIFTQKLSPSGTVLWTSYYNGPNNTIDVGSAIVVDASGNVYITGASEGSFTMMDYVTIKYNGAGSQQWVSRYNFTGAMDIPTGISLSGSDVVVSGSSGTSFLIYDFATVKYNKTSGSQTNVSRTANTNTGAQDQVCSMISDSQGNVYVVGTTFNGSNYDLQLQKLDTALNVMWTQTYAGFGFDDAGINLSMDSNGSIYVAGSSYTSPTTRQLTVLKYSNAGTFKWVRTPCVVLGGTSEGLRLKVKNDDLILIGGNLTTGTNQDLVLLGIDSIGNTVMHRSYDGPVSLNDKFMDLTLDGNDVYVSARSYNGTDDDNIVVKYSYQKFGRTTATSTSGLRYDPNYLVMEFDKQALKMTVINDKSIHFGELTDFVNDSTCNKITDAVDPYRHLGLDAKHFEAQKIFLDFTEADTVTQSRMGNMVRLHDYFAYLLITVPPTLNVLTAGTQLSSIKPDVHTAALNVYLDLASTTSANDPMYNVEQGSLHATAIYPNSHVNCDSAWTITGGEPHINVGIYDSGIDFYHPDLVGQVAKGYNFYGNAPLSMNSDDNNHGTGVSGVVGAVRNNNAGIAGIAGRDFANPNSQGVSIYDCKMSSQGTSDITAFAKGLLKGLQSTAQGGFELDVMNMSVNLAYNYYNYFPNNWAGTSINLMNDASRVGIAMIAAKGNGQTSTVSVATNIFPGDYSDETTMAVGSTGRNGHHCLNTVNCSNASTVWGNIDCSAPGTDSLVKALDWIMGYQQQDGTSFATPHVSGAVSLMMSYYNTAAPNWNNLVHVDCERIIERTCTDLADSLNYPGETMGYDTVTGWGRLNITKALKKINKNYYRFRHITEGIGNTSFSRVVNTVATNRAMTYDENSQVPTGTHSTDIYELTTTFNFNLYPSEVIVDAWPLYKECYGAKLDTSNVVTDRPYHSEIVSVNNSQVVMRTYYYRRNSNNSFFPYIAAQIKSAFTLYTYDSTGTVGIEEHSKKEVQGSILVYPNPSTGVFDVAFNSESNATLTYKVYNVVGQEVRTWNYPTQYGMNNVKLNMSDLPQGVYILNIFDSKNLLHKQKLIKN